MTGAHHSLLNYVNDKDNFSAFLVKSIYKMKLIVTVHAFFQTAEQDSGNLWQISLHDSMKTLNQ